jgi:O-antigen/teichoic acid export membrane protein
MTQTDVNRIARRLVLMIGGEAMQSCFHFALGIALIHVLSAHDYGVFAIVMVIGGVGLTYIRSLTAMPASIWIGQSQSRAGADAYEVTFGSGATLLSALMAVAIALVLRFWADRGAAIAGGCFIGLWSLRSHLRTTFFARGRQRIVGFSDLVFTLSGASLAGVALWAGGDLLLEVFFALTVANTLGIAAMLALSRRPFRISYGPKMRRRYARLWRQLSWSGVSVTTTNLQGQGIALLVTAIAGPAAYAPIAAVLTLFVPLRVAATALVNLMQPELASLLAQSEDERVWRQVKIWAAIMGTGGFAYGAAMTTLLPMIKSQAFEGTPVHLIGIFAWAIHSVTMLYVMPRIVLEAMTAFRTVALITTVAAIISIACITLLLFLAPVAWALAGAAISEIIVLTASWIVVRRRLHGMSEGSSLAFTHRQQPAVAPLTSPGS